MSSGTLIETHQPPRYGALASLAVNLTTAMLLVDYALHGLTTPTPWPGAVAARLPREVRRRFDEVRAFLGHGAVVREFLCGELAEDGAEHRHWPALRAWLAALPRDRVAAMVDLGIAANLDYYNDHEPSPEARALLARVPRTAAGLPDVGVPGGREAALRAVVVGWGVPRPASVVELALDPEVVRAALLEILEALWAAGFEQAWAGRRSALIGAAADAAVRAARPGPLPTDAGVTWITGRQPGQDISALLRGAQRVVFVPCIELGGYLSIVGSGAVRFVLYEPSAGVETGAEAPAAAQALDLAGLGPALQGLGDPTRLAILLRMRECGELTAQRAAEDLAVHQSTISRHLARLEQAELLRVRREDGVRHYRVNGDRVRHVASMLLRALADPAGE